MSTAPGAMLLTVMLCEASSTAMVRMSILKPPLVAQYGELVGMGRSSCTDETLMIGCGVGRCCAVCALRADESGGRLLQLHGRLHHHRGRNAHARRALYLLAAVAQREPVARGIGIIVLFVAIASLAGFGATQLYTAEAATLVQERITPRIRETVKVLALVYGGLTLGGVVVLHLAGMGTFDALNYALTTVSTGGYSTHSDSVGAFDSWVAELAITVGMVLSGTNFAIYYTAARRGLGRAVGNTELITYLGVILASTMLITADLHASEQRDSLVLAFREALFQSASLTTGTAFSTTDWSAWPPFSVALLVLIMAVGGCAGSTAGGMKAIRVYLLARNAAQEMFSLVHPRAVTPLVLGERVLPERLRVGVLGFFFVYVATMVVGTLLIALPQVPVGQAFGSVFSCVNITGAFPGVAGTPQFYADLPATAKTTLAILMLLGRLELLTVLVLLSPAFWRA